MTNTSNWEVAIFASGNGSNAVNIIEYLRQRYAKVSFTIYVNQWREGRQPPGILEKAKSLNVPTVIFNRSELRDKGGVLHTLRQADTCLIALAGFLWLMPSNIVSAYENRIINIHPSLLPKYGGKGMFGAKVHQAVKEHGDNKTGISIHYVNEQYDEGNVILQASTPIQSDDSIEEIAKKVQRLEHLHFPMIVEELLLELQEAEE